MTSLDDADLRARIARALIDVAHDFGHGEAVVVATSKATDAVLAHLEAELERRDALHAEAIGALRAEHDRHKVGHEFANRVVARMERERAQLCADILAMLDELLPAATATGLRWEATYVPPGTADAVETDVVLPAGWWVSGHDREQPDGPVVQFIVEHTPFRLIDDDRTGGWASRIARALNGAGLAEVDADLVDVAQLPEKLRALVYGSSEATAVACHGPDGTPS